MRTQRKGDLGLSDRKCRKVLRNYVSAKPTKIQVFVFFRDHKTFLSQGIRGSPRSQKFLLLVRCWKLGKDFFLHLLALKCLQPKIIIYGAFQCPTLPPPALPLA
jgi:hypothetical protein